MAKVFVHIVTIVIFTSYMITVSFAKTPTWAKTLQPNGSDRKTVLQFYFHDVQTGEPGSPATVAMVAQSNVSSASGFGNLFMADDPLTVSPDPNSKLVGRGQGFYGSASQASVSYIMGMTFGFVDGVYNGSSVVVFGRNPITNQVRELPVVGGTGLFRMARGYAVAQTYFHNSTTHNAIVGYNVTVFHS